MSKYHKAGLCEFCMTVFSSHWLAKDSIPIQDANQAEELWKEEQALGSGDDASSSEHFYEAPDWVTVVTTNNVAAKQSADAYQPPPHHNFAELEVSANRGCHICAMFFDNVKDEIRGLPAHIRANINGLQSYIVARPSSSDFIEEETIQLEMSYFMDGLIKPNTFAFSVEVLLFGIPPNQDVTDESFQPPLYHHDSEDPLSRSIGRIKQWLSECDNHHQACKYRVKSTPSSSSAYRLPTRLLHPMRHAESLTVSLCHAKDRPPQTRYATLSHCWGSLQPARILKENYKQFVRSVDPSSLPQTFQDAITFSLALNIEYLWIDSLCIIQDLPDDWLCEASLMCSVYSNSWINFAATSSRDGSGGLFHKSAFVQNCAIDATWTGLPAGKYLCIDETTWQRRIQNAPLNQRGWVLQERLLSPRTIHCAYDQMWWGCQAAPDCCETFPRGALIPSWAPSTSLTRLHKLSRDNFVLWNNEWLDVVMTYTKTNLTYGSDKLIAFAGIAQVAQGRRVIRETDYLAGLWREGLPGDLLWRVNGTGTRAQTAYRAPSWSWASMTEKYTFNFLRQWITWLPNC